MKKLCSFRVDEQTLELFQRKYPYMLSHFLRLCLDKALVSRDYFEYTCFEDVHSTFRVDSSLVK